MRAPRLYRNPSAETLAALPAWVRGFVTWEGDLYVWDSPSASHERLKRVLPAEAGWSAERAQRLLLDTAFREGVDVQRMGDTSTFALSGETDYAALPRRMRLRIRLTLNAALDRGIASLLHKTMPQLEYREIKSHPWI